MNLVNPFWRSIWRFVLYDTLPGCVGFQDWSYTRGDSHLPALMAKDISRCPPAVQGDTLAGDKVSRLYYSNFQPSSALQFAEKLI